MKKTHHFKKSEIRYIDLLKLKSPVLDFDNLPNDLGLTGLYQGTLIVKNMKKDDRLYFLDAVLYNPGKFAIKAINCERLVMQGFDYTGFIGGIQVIGHLKGGIWLDRIMVSDADVGLHMTQSSKKEHYGPSMISNCKFFYCKHEGFYFGNHKKLYNVKPCPSLRIINSGFYSNGWDNLQISNTDRVYIENSIMIDGGTKRYKWQEKDFILNPGVGRCDLYNCEIGKNIQLSGAENVFIYDRIIK